MNSMVENDDNNINTLSINFFISLAIIESSIDVHQKRGKKAAAPSQHDLRRCRANHPVSCTVSPAIMEEEKVLSHLPLKYQIRTKIIKTIDLN